MRKIIIDTDTGPDEAGTIMMCLREPSIEVLALTTVSGSKNELAVTGAFVQTDDNAVDAWIEPRKQKKGQLLELKDGGTVGFEIPFTRHFYEYTPLRPSAEILAEIRELEANIAEKLQKVL